MKDRKIILQLFGEENGDCAAEQSDVTLSESESLAEIKSEGFENTQNAPEGANGDAEAIFRIGALLGIEAGDEKTLAESITRRKARATLDAYLREMNAKRAYEELLSQASTLSSENESFDISRELSDRRFLALIKSGFGLEEAYKVIHMDEIVRKAEENARKKALEEALLEMRFAALRPEENTRSAAPSKNQRSVESLSGRGIRDILRRVENGAKIKF